MNDKTQNDIPKTTPSGRPLPQRVLKSQQAKKQEAEQNPPEPEKLALNPYSNIKHVIGIVSGKGGVGKSFVTGTLAAALQTMGKSVGILDADITGPSIPKMFGIEGTVKQEEIGLIPAQTKTGIRIMSVNLLLEDKEQPVIWRGPIVGNLTGQFWTDVAWGNLDYLLIDMPPGTGDVPLTVFQSLPIDGIIVVTTPQDLVSLIVKKAINMAKMMDIPVLGLVENMSYVACDDCGHKIYLFGKSKVEEVALELGTRVLAQMPIEPKNATLIDKGAAELIDTDALLPLVDFLGQTFQ